MLVTCTWTKRTLGSVGLSVPIVKTVPICWPEVRGAEPPPLQLDSANTARSERNTPRTLKVRIAYLLHQEIDDCRGPNTHIRRCTVKHALSEIVAVFLTAQATPEAVEKPGLPGLLPFTEGLDSI